MKRSINEQQFSEVQVQFQGIAVIGVNEDLVGLIKGLEEKFSGFVIEAINDLIRSREFVLTKDGSVEAAEIVHFAVIFWGW